MTVEKIWNIRQLDLHFWNAVLKTIAWRQTEFASLEVKQEDIFGFRMIFKSPSEETI